MPCLFSPNNFSHLFTFFGFLPILYLFLFGKLVSFMNDSSDDLTSSDTLSLVSSRNVGVRAF